MAIRGAGSVVKRGVFLLCSLFFCAGALAAEVTYQYDEAGRLKSANYQDGMKVDYRLDAPGNRTSVVTTNPNIDTTPPGVPGTPSFSNIAGTSVTASWTAASDNVAVTAYRYSINGGSSWTNVGNVLTTSISGLSGYTGYGVQVQAGDAAALRNRPAGKQLIEIFHSAAGMEAFVERVMQFAHVELAQLMPGEIFLQGTHHFPMLVGKRQALGFRRSTRNPRRPALRCVRELRILGAAVFHFHHRANQGSHSLVLRR